MTEAERARLRAELDRIDVLVAGDRYRAQRSR